MGGTSKVAISRSSWPIFKSACFEILGLFSVLRDDWSVPERPEMTIKP